jgi:hypothetical protein
MSQCTERVGLFVHRCHRSGACCERHRVRNFSFIGGSVTRRRASSPGLMKLAFLRNAFVQFTGMFDVIFKFTVPFGQFRGHHVNSRRRVEPAR